RRNPSAVDHDRRERPLELLRPIPGVGGAARPTHEPEMLAIDRAPSGERRHLLLDPRRLAVPLPIAPVASELGRTRKRQHRYAARRREPFPQSGHLRCGVAIAMQRYDQRSWLFSWGD